MEYGEELIPIQLICLFKWSGESMVGILYFNAGLADKGGQRSTGFGSQKKAKNEGPQNSKIPILYMA